MAPWGINIWQNESLPNPCSQELNIYKQKFPGPQNKSCEAHSGNCSLDFIFWYHQRIGDLVGGTSVSRGLNWAANQWWHLLPVLGQRLNRDSHPWQLLIKSIEDEIVRQACSHPWSSVSRLQTSDGDQKWHLIHCCRGMLIMLTES